jgi:Tfp pilus assembly protein PilF
MESRKKPSRHPSTPYELARATALWRERKFEDALRCFRKAVRQSPNDVSVLIDAGRALGARFQMDRSTALLNKASRLGSRRADVQYEVGKSFRMLRRVAEAETCFRRACALAITPQAELELAVICERRHALDEADEFVARVLRSEPGSPLALLLRARIARRRGEHEKARNILMKLIGAPSQLPDLLAEAYGEMAVLLDSTGDYDAAWDVILQCKRILQPHEQAAWNAAQFVLSRCSRMIDGLSAEQFLRWQSTGESGAPQHLALLTGFPRSGTTLLERVLDAHPKLVSCEEADIFSTEVFPSLGENCPPDYPIDAMLEELSPDQIRAGQAVYFAAFQAIVGEPIGSQLLLDKNPAMNLMIPVMRRVFPELQLIIALRDPRDVVLSCFLRYLPLNPVSVCFLTLERTVDRLLLDMGAWLKLRDMLSDWIEVRYEDVVTDLDRESRRTLEFLDMPWDQSVLTYHGRATGKQVRSPSYEEVSRPVFTTSIGRWRNYERHLAPVLSRLSPLMAEFGYKGD